jgi:cytochrome P450
MANADPVRTWIMAQCGRKALSPDGLGAQVDAAVDAGELSEQEALIIVRSFLSGGLDITVSGLSAALSCFACHPRQWRMLREKPALARQAFEEAIRFGSPVQTFFRTTTREAEVAGIRLGDNDKVLLFLAATNRERINGKAPIRST